MPAFSPKSDAFLDAAHPSLARLFREVIKHYDCSILGSIRTVEEQRANVAKGLSQTMDSKHLPGPDGLSRAVDAAPYPQRWDDPTKAKITTQWDVDLEHFDGFVRGYAAALGIPIRWGGDWD